MNRRFKLGITAATLLCCGAKSLPKEAHYFRFLGEQDHEFVLQPMISPLFSVKQVAGSPLQEHALVACVWKEETRVTEHGDKVPGLVGECEEGVRLTLIGIDLNH